MKYIFVWGLLASFLFSSCLKEDIVPVPTVTDVKMYMSDIDGNDSLITQATVGESFKFVVETDADIATVWPAGERRVMKMTNSEADSLDMFGNPVLIKSDYYSDYGLVKARGYKTALGETGWYFSYTYEEAGEYEPVIVITNHGYQSADYKQVVHYGEKVVVTE